MDLTLERRINETQGQLLDVGREIKRLRMLSKRSKSHAAQHFYRAREKMLTERAQELGSYIGNLYGMRRQMRRIGA